MRKSLTVVSAVCCALTAGIHVAPALAADEASKAAPAGESNVTLSGQGPVKAELSKPSLELSQEQQQAVIEAVLDRKSHQPTPPEFKPAVGAAVPKAVNIHGLPRPLVYEVPALKEYAYAHLDREVVIIDAIGLKVAAVIPLPENLATGPQKPTNEAAAQAVDRLKESGTAQTTGSAPGAGQSGAGNQAGGSRDPLRHLEDGNAAAYTGPHSIR
jgi:hypothetical protein